MPWEEPLENAIKEEVSVNVPDVEENWDADAELAKLLEDSGEIEDMPPVTQDHAEDKEDISNAGETKKDISDVNAQEKSQKDISEEWPEDTEDTEDIIEDVSRSEYVNVSDTKEENSQNAGLKENALEEEDVDALENVTKKEFVKEKEKEENVDSSEDAS